MNRYHGRQTSFSSNADSRYGIGLQGQVQSAASVLLDGYARSSEGSQASNQRHTTVYFLHLFLPFSADCVKDGEKPCTKLIDYQSKRSRRDAFADGGRDRR